MQTEYLAINFPRTVVDNDDSNPKTIALFDFDGTLVTNANGKPAYQCSDFVLLYNVERTLNELLSNGTHVIIITNQKHLSPEKCTQFQKFNALFQHQLSFLIAHQQNIYRKPNPTFIQVIRNQPMYLNATILYYCGDAVGSSSEYLPYQWNDTDYQFAVNANIPFFSPRDLFGTMEFERDIVTQLKPMVIMMGNQGSGKTTLAHQIVEHTNHAYTCYSQDEIPLHTKKMQKQVLSELQAGRCVIIDATNGRKTNRDVWTTIAKNAGIEYVILWRIIDGRPFNEMRNEGCKVPAIAYATYSKYFDYPSSDEHYYIVS